MGLCAFGAPASAQGGDTLVSADSPPSPFAQNRYTLPRLSVRMVHPLAPLIREKVPDEELVFLTTMSLVQWLPPSVERAATNVCTLDPTLGPPL